MKNKKQIIHVVDVFISGVPKTNCGKYVSPEIVTAYPAYSNCKKCIATKK